MDFFKSLSDVRRYRGDLKTWEKNQEDDVARREALINKKQPSEKELNDAKVQGENIIKIIDIMDNHSESVAENVETAVAPIVATVPVVAAVTSAALYGYFNFIPNNKKASVIYDKIAKDHGTKQILNEIREYNYRHNVNQRVSDGVFKSKNGYKKIRDSKLSESVKEISQKYLKETSAIRRNKTIGGAIAILATVASFIGVNLWTTKLQVDSSRIARYQARESLSDPKNFVSYTPEQIAAAEEAVKQNGGVKKASKKKKGDLKQGFFGSIAGILKDRRSYKNAKANDTDESKLVQRELTQDELEQAQRDKDVIQRTIRVINNKAEFYSENMETAAGVLIGGTPVLGAVVGGITGFVIKKLGLTEKFVKNYVANNGSEEAKKLFNELGTEACQNNKLLYNMKWGKFFKELTNGEGLGLLKPRKMVGEQQTKRTLGTLMSKIKQYLAGALAHRKGASWVIGGVGTVITGLAGLILGLKLQKSAARAGRYTAKRELEDNPANFIGYTDEEYDSVAQVSSTDKKESKFKQYATFIPTVIKQYFAYNKYKKHEFLENKALHEELLKQDVSEKQLADAKNLQRKLFNTFEKVDDNSQLYSESMEAAVEMAQPVVVYGMYAAMLAPFAVIASRIANGKLSISKVIDKLMTFLSKSSKITKTKFFKKYLKQVNDTIPTKIQARPVDAKPLGALLEGTNVTEDTIWKLMEKLGKNLKMSPDELRSVDASVISKKISELRASLNKMTFSELKNMFNDSGAVQSNTVMKKIDGILAKLQRADNETRINLLDILMNPSSVEKMGNEQLEGAVELCKNMFKDVFPKVEKLNPNILKNISSARVEATDAISAALKESFEAAENILNKLAETDPNKIKQLLEKYKGKKLADISEIKTILMTLKESSNNADVSKYIDSMLSLDVGTLLGEGKIEKLTALLENVKNEYIVKAKEAFSSIENAKLKDVVKIFKFNDLSFEKIENSLKTMDDKQFADFMRRMPGNIRMDKQTLESIFPKVKTIINNIPKEELAKIENTIIKEFNEHPDEFVDFVKNGKITELFNTPMIRRTVVAAGISWVAFNVVITYVIEAWLADMQLKAGRLGVMKALDSLQDERYYADIA